MFLFLMPLRALARRLVFLPARSSALFGGAIASTPFIGSTEKDFSHKISSALFTGCLAPIHFCLFFVQSLF